jgi:class 3 adenylate cyclase/tetratricopeptide (TPR) repeat protein
MASPPSSAAGAEQLVSFVPRLTIEWLRDDPGRTWVEVDGTLAFVDISGFTAMSEKLSNKGKRGAEEISDVMNATFAALLDVAYGHGGGLLKFGGDALLLLYTGDGHAGRAARSAFEMRRVLDEIGRPETSAGTVELRMHVGLHSGRFHFFLVGESHRELLVTGPAATATVEMESASEAGELLLSPDAAEALPPGVVGVEKGPGLLLAAAPQVDGFLTPLPDVAGVDLEQAVPAPLRMQLLEVGPLEGEHRQAAIGFLRFQGVDELIGREGPAAAAEALDALVRGVQAAADEHTVTFLESDIDTNGGKIILIAGAPHTAGDDEERLLRAVRSIVDASPPLPVHVGVSRGRVFAGQVGSHFRRTYTVLGDTAALAARLMARAGPNEILVSAEAFQRSSGSFAATELEPFMVKGKSAPVEAVSLGPLVGVDAGEAPKPKPARELPFVDRERERAVLSASVAPVRMGYGTLVELVGEPGIGKSRLADELRAHCEDMATLTARCEQYESATAYHPFRPLLRGLLDVDLNGGGSHNLDVLTERLRQIDDELVPWAPLLSAPLDVAVDSTPEVDELDPSFRRARLHGFVGSLLGGLMDKPALMLFEDVHWMDEPSSELLRHLGTQVSGRPWILCTTRRPGDGGFTAAEGTPPLPALTLRLEPIPPEDAKKLVESAFGEGQLSEEELQTLAERGAGNPLFLQELATSEATVEAPEELPETVEALLATRIDRLAPGDRALLRWASVLGSAFSGSLIADVLVDDPSAASDSEAWDRLAEFVERDPDVPGGFRFRHALIRDTAYEGLSYRRRRELHGRVAEAMVRRLGDRAADEAELLSLHFHQAARWPEVWSYSLEAGRRAQEKWANVEAVEFYRRAVEASRSGFEVAAEEVAAVWESVGDCLRLTGDLEEAARAYASARRLLAKDSLEQIRLMSKEGQLREDMGKYSDAIRWYSRGLKAVDLLPESPDRITQRLEFMIAWAQARFRQGAFRDCIRRGDQVVREALDAENVRILAWAYLLLHLAHTMLGSPDRRAFSGLALPLFEELGDLKRQAAVLGNLGIEAYYDGDWEKALDLYERSRELHERIGDMTHVILATNNIGEILSDQGHLEDAERLFNEVAASSDGIGHELMSAVARANLGRAAARDGRFDEARGLLEGALESLWEMEATSFALEAELRLVELEALRGGRPRELLAEVDSLLERTDEAAAMAPLRASIHRIRAVALAQLGEKPEAEGELGRSVEVAREAEAVHELALALHVAGLLGDDAAANETGALFQRLGIERVARPPLSAPAD